MLSGSRAGGLRAAGAALLFASLFPVVSGIPAACAAEGARAVLVVDTGETVQRMCVALPRSQVSGTELIALAGEQHGLTYRFGYGGGAVCMLAGVGAESDDCFEKYPDFWGYWRGNGSGGWSWSSTGAGSTRVTDGDVEGWSWGSGNDGSSHPAPPNTTFSSVCAATRSAAPKEDPPDRAGPRSSSERTAGADRTRDVTPQAPVVAASDDDAASPAPPKDSGSKAREEPPRRPRARPARAEAGRGLASPEPVATSADEVAARAPGDPEDGPAGPPPAGLAALAGAGLLGGAGAWLARRKRTRP